MFTTNGAAGLGMSGNFVMDSATTLMLGVIYGAIGMGYLVYARQQRKGVALISGVGLIVIPYLIPGVVWLIVAGVVLVALPFWVRY
jgi:hypothetical protein